MAEERRKRRGRPRVAAAVQQITILVPEAIYDACCREALARDVPLAVIIREAILRSRQARGEYST